MCNGSANVLFLLLLSVSSSFYLDWFDHCFSWYGCGVDLLYVVGFEAVMPCLNEQLVEV